MRGQHSLFESVSIEWAWFSAGFPVNQRIADIFTVDGIVASINPRFNAAVLLISPSNGLAHDSHNTVLLQVALVN
ncbi:hypothetical protein [Sulfuriferula nivalis]|uniref:Uncharacterized protein n=1 Tax=Sulfuriferula nivalis TaxID=2675298 RepID=A0A809RJ30_9PROT|nr:hypothetical protein [Sulfuriferula nivalis]BBP01929.1 hypothetical protein SFSGTM_26370 [Sulfuriferula nivalis]